MKEMEKMKNKREEKRAQISEIRTRRAQVEYSMPIRGNYKVIQPGSCNQNVFWTDFVLCSSICANGWIDSSFRMF